MIEEMITEVNPYLPLKISEVLWDGTIFNMYGEGWGFATISSWRISTKDKMVFGCFDSDSKQLIKFLNTVEILDLTIQNDDLKIDPVFILSNGQKIEIFSTDTYEPWTFHVEGLPYYSG